MRFILIVVALISVSSSPAFSLSETNFDAFIKSREIVATVYFQANNENLSNVEQKRLFDNISKLRELQKNGRMIRVEGFSSPEGDQEKNFHLSFFRARSVADLIEGKGLPAAVTLTGYGDLQAGPDNPGKERRVEIASYLKPVGIKRVKIAEKKKKVQQTPEPDTARVDPENQEIDSYRIEQAIKRKIGGANKNLVDKNKELEQEPSPDLSQTEDKKVKDKELDQGYSQWRQSVDPSASQKLSQAEAADDSKLKQGYSQWKKSTDPESSPGVTQILPVEAPVIDALMIEQAIMEKIGTKPLIPSGTVTQVNVNY